MEDSYIQRKSAHDKIFLKYKGDYIHVDIFNGIRYRGGEDKVC